MNQSNPPKNSNTDAVDYNRQAWDEVALQGDKLYHAVTPDQIAAAKAGKWTIRVTPMKALPESWLQPIAGKKILCLAAGGGQQGPVLAALGGDVTVADLSNLQLARDRKVADRERLSLTTVNVDMSDLSCFADESFEMIVNPCSVIFCPDVKPVWQEAYRVLRPGGRLISGFINPVYYLFDAAKMDRGKLKVRHKIPYSDLDLDPTERQRLLGPDRPLEFGHTLSDLIGGQLDCGFQLQGFFEDRWGGEDRLSDHLNVFVATCAVKN